MLDRGCARAAQHCKPGGHAGLFSFPMSLLLGVMADILTGTRVMGDTEFCRAP